MILVSPIFMLKLSVLMLMMILILMIGGGDDEMTIYCNMTNDDADVNDNVGDDGDE